MELMGFERRVENSNRGVLDALCNVDKSEFTQFQSIKDD